MPSTNARNGTLIELHERRKQVVRMHCDGHRVMEIVRLSGLSYPAVRSAIDRFEAGGLDAITPKARGRKTGMGRGLTAEQEVSLRHSICTRRPEQLKIEAALWTRSAVIELIKSRCGVQLSVRAVANYLKRWGFAPQRQIKRADEGRAEALKWWLDTHYPAIEARARAERGEIHWCEEALISDVDAGGFGRASGGRAASGVPGRLAMISAATRQRKLSWLVYDATNEERVIEFLKAFVRDRRKVGNKGFLILDNLPGCRSKPVKAWTAAHAKDMEVFYLPDYGPDPNPGERLITGSKGPIASDAPVHSGVVPRAAAAGGMATRRDPVQSRFHSTRGEHTAENRTHAQSTRRPMASDLPAFKSVLAKRLDSAMAPPAPFTQDARVLDAMAQSDGDPNFVTGLARGLAILLALADKKHHMTIAQISRRTGIPRAAARRGLYTLAKLGFVAVDEVRGFSLRPTVLTFSHAYLSASPLAVLAQPILDRLGEAVKEACSVAVLDGDEIVYIARSASSRLMTSSLKVGHRLPAYCTSIGLVMLAQLPSEDLGLYLERAKFFPYTEFTPTTQDQILEILKDVREHGFAFASQQMELRFCSIAVPIRDSGGRYVAGMNVILQGRLLTADKMVARYLKPLRDAALEMGTLLCP